MQLLMGDGWHHLAFVQAHSHFVLSATKMRNRTILFGSGDTPIFCVVQNNRLKDAVTQRKKTISGLLYMPALRNKGRKIQFVQEQKIAQIAVETDF